MSIDGLKTDWALWLAVFPAVIVMFMVALAIYRRSARGQLSRVLHAHRQAEKALLDGRKGVAKAVSRVEKLADRVDKVKPRVLEEAKGSLADCRALEKIASDKCQVTMNQLRRIIFEEFPPASHEGMREKYLPQDVKDGRPFSF